mmetsp:Transcript_45615/g.111022  ORF Transcript_45615/g.111022 Transcript_45615/m.111022 type:complete len:384 (-) Transcript_45615:213-1364(-)
MFPLRTSCRSAGGRWHARRRTLFSLMWLPARLRCLRVVGRGSPSGSPRPSRRLPRMSRVRRPGGRCAQRIAPPSSPSSSKPTSSDSSTTGRCGPSAAAPPAPSRFWSRTRCSTVGGMCGPSASAPAAPMLFPPRSRCRSPLGRRGARIPAPMAPSWLSRTLRTVRRRGSGSSPSRPCGPNSLAERSRASRLAGSAGTMACAPRAPREHPWRLSTRRLGTCTRAPASPSAPSRPILLPPRSTSRRLHIRARVVPKACARPPVRESRESRSRGAKRSSWVSLLLPTQIPSTTRSAGHTMLASMCSGSTVSRQTLGARSAASRAAAVLSSSSCSFCTSSSASLSGPSASPKRPLLVSSVLALISLSAHAGSTSPAPPARRRSRSSI